MTSVGGCAALREDIEARGLAWRGAFHPAAADAVPPLPGGRAARTLVLIGFAGGQQWPGFASSLEASDGQPHPLNRWSRRLVEDIARGHDGLGLYPADGPPWLPFQRWAQRAEPIHPSPLGILIHAEFGLWHSYRGAIALPVPLALPKLADCASPCASCVARPCMSSCPVGAFRPGTYDTAACIAHVASPAGRDCLELGCRARRSCPVGREHHYSAEQAGFHMRAFIR